MNLLHGLAWLASIASRRKTGVSEPDLADMGTAFGLDASIGLETQPEPAPCAKRHADDKSRFRNGRLLR